MQHTAYFSVKKKISWEFHNHKSSPIYRIRFPIHKSFVQNCRFRKSNRKFPSISPISAYNQNLQIKSQIESTIQNHPKTTAKKNHQTRSIADLFANKPVRESKMNSSKQIIEMQ